MDQHKAVRAQSGAKFTKGATMRHVVVMTSTSSLGLMTLFLVDFADMFFLSLLGERELVAAIGYAGSILFFTTSICIGLSITVTALCSRAIGAGHWRRARRFAINTSVAAVLFTAIVAAVIWIFTPNFLSALGAFGKTLDMASGYLRIIVPTLPLLALGLCASGMMRAAGDARRAMYVTLSGAGVNAILDPILIFQAGLGLDGAAWASVGARIAVLAVGLYGAFHVHHLIGRFRPAKFFADVSAISRIAVPAILTNVATPLGNAYIVAAIAKFGDPWVAGFAVVTRVVPVAFGIIFSLSGAVGPIIGQNFGARLFDRVRQSFIDALVFATAFVGCVTIILYFVQDNIISFFSISGDAALLIGFFCTWIAASFLFNSALFVSNAAFNNLGRPELSTMFNWGKATIGTIPPAIAGGLWFGAYGVLAGQAIGAVFFGVAATVSAFALIKRLEHKPGSRPRARPGGPLPRQGWWRNPVNKGHDI